jgi:ubiquinone biosynthesis protein UbiJ
MRPDEILQQVFYSLASQVTRALLHLDPGTRTRLQKLSGHVAAFHLDQSPLRVYVCFSESGMEFSADSRVPADAFVRLSIEDLLFLFSSSFSVEDEWYEDATIDGDRELVKSLFSILSGLDVDWEGAISPVTGDVVAHELGKSARSAERWLRESAIEVQRLAREYVDQEWPVARESELVRKAVKDFEAVRERGSTLKATLASVVADIGEKTKHE